MAASQCAVLRCRPEDWAAARQPCLGTKTVQILQAQPGTLQALQQVAITLIPVLPSFLPLPWPHKVYCMWTQVFSVVSVFFHPTRVYVRPHLEKKLSVLHQSWDSIETQQAQFSTAITREILLIKEIPLIKGTIGKNKVQSTLGICLYPHFQGKQVQVHQQWAQANSAGLCHI